MPRKLASIIVLATALAAPAAAHANASLTVSGGSATLAGDGGANTLVAINAGAGAAYFFGEQGGTTMASGGLCLPTTQGGIAGQVCTGIGAITINGGDGADQLVANATFATTVNGQAGDDTLIGGTARNVFTGGAGTDRVAYVQPEGAMITRSAAVKATLPNSGSSGDNGQSGENDSIASDVEGLVGGGQNDTLTGNGGPNTIAGAAPPGTAGIPDGPGGTDTIRGGAGDDTLLGGDSGTVAGEDGKDQVVGGRSRSATTTVTGGPGDDTLVSNLGKDDLAGGAGTDALAYASVDLAGIKRTKGITLKLPDAGGSTNGNGEAGEGDVVRGDFETLAGSNGNDTITGNNAPNTIAGAAPAGTAGVTPGPPGNDRLEGGGGADLLLGSSGNDTLRARDGVKDTAIVCAAGTDSVVGDAVDTAGPDCEDVDGPSRGSTPTVPTTPTGPSSKDSKRPKLTVKPRKLRLREGRRVRVSVRCRNEQQGCRGTVRLKRGKRTLAKRKFAIKGNGRKRVTLRLPRGAAKRLRDRGRTPVTLRVRARDDAGNRRTKTVNANLRPS